MPRSLIPLSRIDCRPLFRPVMRAFVDVLRQLPPDDWQRPVRGTWLVRDVVAHMLDTTLRRLSFHRDSLQTPPPPFPITSNDELVRFINLLNSQWTTAAQRLSRQVLTDLYDMMSTQVADFFEALPLDAPALFPVSWAGESTSEGWFDLAREFTEVWHHQQQVRDAVGVPPLADPRYLRAVLDTSVRVLPHTFREIPAAIGEEVGVEITGASGGEWTLRRTATWELWAGSASSAVAAITCSDDTAWRLWFNGLTSEEAERCVQSTGRSAFGDAFRSARSVIV